MACVLLLIQVLGYVPVFVLAAASHDDQGFTYKHVTSDLSVVELECRSRVYFDDHEILEVSIYNMTTMAKIVRLEGGECPRIQDTAHADLLYLPACVGVPEKGRRLLRILILGADYSPAHTFICNITKRDEDNRITPTVLAVTVDRPGSPTNADIDYSGHTWLPDPAYKMLAGIEQEVRILEPAMIGMIAILAIILFSLAAQLFLSCKILRYVERRKPRGQYQFSGSQTKMSEHNKSTHLEEQPFYASV